MANSGLTDTTGVTGQATYIGNGIIPFTVEGGGGGGGAAPTTGQLWPRLG